MNSFTRLLMYVHEQATHSGVISVQERANYMARVRDLAKGSCKAWIDSQSDAWTAKYPGWTL